MKKTKKERKIRKNHGRMKIVEVVHDYHCRKSRKTPFHQIQHFTTTAHKMLHFLQRCHSSPIVPLWTNSFRKTTPYTQHVRKVLLTFPRLAVLKDLQRDLEACGGIL